MYNMVCNGLLQPDGSNRRALETCCLGPAILFLLQKDWQFGRICIFLVSNPKFMYYVYTFYLNQKMKSIFFHRFWCKYTFLQCCILCTYNKIYSVKWKKGIFSFHSFFLSTYVMGRLCFSTPRVTFLYFFF